MPISIHYPLLVVILFVAIFLRYLLINAVFYQIFYIKLWNKFAVAQVIKSEWKTGQLRSETLYSLVTSLIFAAVGALMVWLWEVGMIQVYTEIGAYGYWYLPTSFAAVLIIQDAYYYWLHRWMHTQRRVYSLLHKVHHDSVVPSPWTSFSFHPTESVVQAIILPVILLFLPVHYIVLLLLLLTMTISATINHLNVDLMPKVLRQSIFAKYLIGATHHAHHHTKAQKNFGLYFTYWDRWLGTEYEN
ncbi:MAG: sterol desaturase family protein [Saprospiraceae bacterium]